MKNLFEIAGASVIGRSHRIEGKNNQDSFFYLENDKMIIGLVSDGCGSGKNSEVGAKLGVRMIANAIVDTIAEKDILFEEILEKARLDVLSQIRVLANSLGLSFSRTVVDYFLFTLVGFIITDDETIVFSLGDGVLALNGEIKDLGPFPQNAPPYIAYGITNTSLGEKNPDLLKFCINHEIKTSDLESLMIGTDGVGDLIKCEEKNIPGKEEIVGSLNQFWEEEKFFQNKDMLRRRISLINTDIVKYKRNTSKVIVEVKKENGLLSDDTTLIVVRKKPTEKG